jgi:hypothetical protein
LALWSTVRPAAKVACGNSLWPAWAPWPLLPVAAAAVEAPPPLTRSVSPTSPATAGAASAAPPRRLRRLMPFFSAWFSISCDIPLILTHLKDDFDSSKSLAGSLRRIGP